MKSTWVIGTFFGEGSVPPPFATRFARLASLGAVAFAASAACSASSGKNEVPYNAGGSGPGGSTSGGAAGTGFGGFGGTGGGVGGFGGTGPAGGSGGSIAQDGSCAGVVQEAKPQLQPADIIWAIDTSCSMIEEAQALQLNMNGFSAGITASGIDVHVVLIASYPFFIIPGVCMEPPLGKQGGCPSTAPGSDNNPPSFFHDPNGASGMQSTDGLNVLKTTFVNWGPLLRPGALHHVAIVTDDEASDAPYGTMGSPDAGADQFIADFKALSPLLADFKMSGIYSYTACPNAANVSNVWKSIIDKTGGVAGDICTCPAGNLAACQATFQSVFQALAEAIITGAQALDCQWGIPPPPAGQQFDASQVNVIFTNAGVENTIYGVLDQSQCDPVNGGWYYDNPSAPTTVIACPATCDSIKASADGKIDVQFGCATIKPPA